MKRIIYSFIFFALILSLCACSSNLSKGEVYEKNFIAAHSSPMLIPLVTVHSTGKTTFTTTTMIPIIRHYPDTYEIHIRAWNEEKEVWDTAVYYVDKVTYESINIGDYFEYSSETCMKEQPYIDEEQ